MKKTYPDYIEKSKFVFDIIKADDRADYRNEIPEMNEIESWKGQERSKDLNSIIRYIIFMYDKNSGFIKKFNDVKKRRENAISESGIDPKIMNEKRVVIMITGFLVYQNDRLWHMICLHQKLFIEYSNLLMGDIVEDRDKDLISATKVKEEIRQNLIKVNASLDTFLEDFYQGDSELKEEIDKNLKWSPERISKMSMEN